MTPRISAVLAGTLLAAFGLFATAPQSQSKANPVEAARLNNLGAAYMIQQLFEKGLKSFRQAAELDPKLAIARLNEGIALLNLQKIDDAKTALETALKQDPKIPNAWYNLGLLAKNTGDAQAAIDAFKHVIDLDANDADTWYFLGASYVQAKQFPQAIEAFQHALQLNPIHASAEFGLSRAYQQSTDLDHAREHLKKFQYITQNKSGAPMSLAYGEQGKYSRAVESPQVVLKAPAQIKVRFVDVTKEAGIVSRGSAVQEDNLADGLGAGACFLDYDGDGRPDLFVAQGGLLGGLGLYHNLGNGKFEEVTRSAALNPEWQGSGCTAGDFDNDGATDLAVSFWGRPLSLFHNEKNGKFNDVSTSIIRGRIPCYSAGLTFVDYDHDGDLDLYVTRIEHGGGPPRGSSGPPVWNNMFRNNGDGSFTDVTFTTGLIGYHPGSTVAAVGTDYNNDRAVDLIVTDQDPTVYENPREGQFISRRLWSSPMPAQTIGVAVLDFD